MATKKQQEKKKKDRERAVSEKVLRRRVAMRAQRKLAQDEELQRQYIESMSHGKLRPIVKDQEKANQMEAIKAKAVSEQLKRNLEILEALEQEYDEEQKNRIAVNEQLESEGFVSVKEKMDALHQKALQMTGKAELLAEAQQDFDAQQKL